MLIAIVYHSGYGHTKHVTESVAKGVASVQDATAKIMSVEDVQWETLEKADAIIFGCPTYMGGPSGPFKTFIDQCAKVWVKQTWKDKIAAGFTNSNQFSGDKLATLQILFNNAMQQSMIWVGLGLLPPHGIPAQGPDGNAINRLGAFGGLMTATGGNDAPSVPTEGDKKTAELFGARVATVTAQFLKGRS